MDKKTGNYKIKNFGPLSKRRDYSNTKFQLETQDLLVMQKESFKLFLRKGIEETLKEIFPITSNNQKLSIDYITNSKRIEKPKDPAKTIQEARKKGTTYAAKLYIKLRKTIVETGEVKEEEVLFGSIPLLTEGTSFIINGSEKVIVSQLIRSAGAYYGLKVRNKQSDDLFNKLEILPRLGSWFEMFHKVTSNNIDSVKVRIDKTKSISLSIFLRALGFSKETIFEYFGDSQELLETMKKEKFDDIRSCRQAIHQIIKKGDRITNESLNTLFYNLFFNKRRYNLSPTGRYVINRKLRVSDRLLDRVLAEDLVAQETNENYKKDAVIFKKGHIFEFKDLEIIDKLYEDGILKYEIIKDFENIEDLKESIYGRTILIDPKYKKRNKISIIKVFSKNNPEKVISVIGNDSSADETTLLISDITAAISYYFNLLEGIGTDDDPDSLINKKIVLVGELIQNQFKIALTKVEKNAKEKMQLKEIDKITPKYIINNKPVYNQFKTFFNSSKLSQFMDQTNPLGEISNKRRVTSLGPGGLNRDTAQFEVRDVHPTHYGRICPIETPEGPNIGLILNLATYARINELGFLETPYFKVNNGVVDYSKPIYLTALEEKGFHFAQSSINVDENNKITDKAITVRKDHDFLIVKADQIDFIDVSSKQMISVAASAIPFLENNDANRALMGSNMQRQAVPLLRAEAPIVATGIEADIAKYSSSNLRAKEDGEIIFVDSTKIKIQDETEKIHVYNLKSYQRSNQGTLIRQKSLYPVGKKVKEGDLLTDASSFDNGELALGKNVLVGFSTWNGYNYEDAIIINERLVKDDVFTSIHIEEQVIQFRKAKNHDDELTRDIPNASAAAKRFLDENGIVLVGSEVGSGDILVGRITPKGEYNPTPEEKLMTAIFGQRDSSYLDTSLKVKHGQGGTVIGVDVLSREHGDSLEDGIDKIIKVSIAQRRKIKVGDKMAGRHGNKGVISIILPEEDMPHLEDGTALDIMLNPQGVPSRMNLGQVLELHLGMIGRKLKEKFVTPSFDGIKKEQISALLEEAGLPENGKLKLINPIDGETIDNDVSIGVMYMLKLSHMVDDKMHARSVGPYSLITQQPLGGKSQNGGQRFGEMETWALESYGATNILQELLTYKSDNISGRNKLYNALSTDTELPTPGTPESFNVLAYELRGLGIKLEVHESHTSKENQLEKEGN